MMEPSYYEEIAIDYENEASTTDGAIKQAAMRKQTFTGTSMG